MINTSAQVIVRQLQKSAVRRALEANQSHAGLGKTVVLAVLDILDEMLDQSGGDEKAGVLETRNSLEGDSDHFIILNDGTTAIAGIDGGIGLAGEVGAIADVAVGLQFDAGNDAARVGDLLSTGGITVRDDG